MFMTKIFFSNRLQKKPFQITETNPDFSPAKNFSQVEEPGKKL